jgi:hypothetical protein
MIELHSILIIVGIIGIAVGIVNHDFGFAP